MRPFSLPVRDRHDLGVGLWGKVHRLRVTQRYPRVGTMEDANLSGAIRRPPVGSERAATSLAGFWVTA